MHDFKGSKNRIMADFSTQTMKEKKRQWNDVFKMLKEKVLPT